MVEVEHTAASPSVGAVGETALTSVETPDGGLEEPGIACADKGSG